jgi:hypothetical protein
MSQEPAPQVKLKDRASLKSLNPARQAKDPDADPSVLEALAGSSVTVDRLLASHANAGSDLLENLAHSSDKATRKRVALNANTSKATLVRLAPQFPGDFFKNPVFDWLLLEEPDLLTRIGGGVLKNILKRPDCPHSFLNWAVAHGKEEEKLAVAMNPDAPADVLAQLAAMLGKATEAARHHVRFPALEDAIDLELAFRTAVAGTIADACEAPTLAQWAALPPTTRLLVSLAVHPPLLAAYIARHASPTFPDLNEFPEYYVRRYSSMWRSFSGVRRSVFDIAELFENFVEHLSELPNYPCAVHHSFGRDSVRGRGIVARHPATQSAILSNLASDAASSVREAVAGNSSTSAITLTELARDAALSVREAVARNPATPFVTLAELARNTVDWQGIRVCCEVARNSATPVTALTDLAREAEPSVRAAVASNPLTPTITLSELARDTESSVRKSVAGNSSTPGAALAELVKDVESSVRDAVAHNPSTPKRVLSELAGDTSRRVRRSVAENPATPVGMLRALARDVDEWVREAVARNPSTPAGTLIQLAKDEDSSAREFLAQNPSTPASTLSELAKYENSFLYYGFFSNPLAPWDAFVSIDHMARKGRIDTRELVAQHPNSPKELLLRMTKDKNVLVRLAAARRCSVELWSSVWREALEHDYPQALIDWGYNGVMADSPVQAWMEDELEKLLYAPRRSMFWAWRRRKITNRELRAACDDENLLFLDDRKAEKACRKRSLVHRLLGLSHRLAAPDVLASRSKSVEWVERLAVARNPNTPPNVIETLKKDPNRRVARQAEATAILKAEAVNRQSRILEEGVTSTADSELIVEIGQRLKHLYPLPGTIPTSRWVELLPLGQWVDQIGFDPAWTTQNLPGDLIEDISRYWMDSGQIFRKEGEAIRWHKFPTTLAFLTEQAVPLGVMKCIAENTNTPAATLVKLAGHKNLDVREAVAKHPAAPGDVLMLLASDRDWGVRYGVASNPATPIDLLTVLARDSDSDLRREVAGNPATPVEALTLLARDQERDVRWAIAENRATPTEVLISLAGDKEPYVRRAVAANPATPIDVLTLLAKDPNRAVRSAVAQNGATPIDLLIELSGDQERDVRRAVAGNLATPLEVLRELPRNRETYLLWSYAKDLAVPTELLTVLAEDPDWCVRSAVAANATTPVEVLTLLARDQERDVRWAVAGNRATPTEVVISLVGDKEPYVRRAVAANPATPVEMLTLLARDQEKTVRLAIADNPAIPVELLAALASDITLHPFWRLRYAQHPNFAGSAAESVIQDCIHGLRARASSPRPEFATMTDAEFTLAFKALGVMPAADDKQAVANATKSKDWLTRAAATYVREIQPSLLKALLEDSVDAVRQRAVFRLRSGKQGDAA